MAKYIVDMDALIKCCDFLSIGKLNGGDYTYVDNVIALLQRFPKDKIEETITIEAKNNIKMNKTEDDITRYLNKIARGEDTITEDLKL